MSLPPPVEPAEEVFVNASMRMGSIEAVGFDMDYTLATYDSVALDRLAFSLAIANLRAMGYPDLIGNLEYRPGSTIRGLVVDKRLGNVLKMDQYGFVSVVFHGDQEWTREERRGAYANQSIPLGTERYTSVDTLFHMPEVDLFLQLVEAKDANPEAFGPRNYALLWSDLRHAIDLCHSDGSMKAEVVSSPERYLVEDPDLPAALATLRQQGKQLFLLTNSELEYTQAVMSYLFDGQLEELPAWTDYFDEVVVEARKPGFFLKPSAGEVAHEVVNVRGEKLELVAGGNYRELHQALGTEGDRVLFVGDHIYGDVIRSKTHSFWRTLMVVPELEQEIEVGRETRRTVGSYLQLFDRVREEDRRRAALVHQLVQRPGDESLKVDLERADEAHGSLAETLEQAEIDIDRAFHSRWGALFQDGGETSRFGAQVVRYADLYTSRVSNLARYSGDKWFHTPWQRLPHHFAPIRGDEA
jgi:HAD superfamily 5'-nucleotidase-like hydrolase